MAEPITYHRAPAFVEVYAAALGRLRRSSRPDNQVLSFASSGTGAMESAVANLVAPGDPVAVASAGKFGERWVELCRAYGAEMRAPGRRVGRGDRPGPARGETVAAMPEPPKAVFVDAVGDLDRGRARRSRRSPRSPTTTAQ